MSTRTITARDLPPRHFTAEDRKAAGYECKGRTWYRNGEPLCSRPDRGGYMRMVNGRLERSPAPPVCCRLASVRMVRSGRYYCAFHAPKKGEREVVERLAKGEK